MNKNILIVTPSIKPGGGPPGYVHNLMTGYDELKSKGLNKNVFTFLGTVSEERNKATGESSEKNINFINILVKLASKLGLKPLLSNKLRYAKKCIKNCDLLIIQGFQELYLSRYAVREGIPIVYMPHSPSILADEYKMLSDINGDVFNQSHFNKLKSDELELINNAGVIAFPSRGASIEYIKAFEFILDKKKVIFIKSGVKVKDIKSLQESSCSITADSDINVYFFGRYISHKGYDLFCDAVNVIGGGLDQVKFNTVGAGPMKSDCEFINNLGWRNDVFSVIAAADIIVIPNRIAYYDLLPLECAALGKPLVMTCVGGNVDQMSDLPDVIPCIGIDASSLAFSIKNAIEKFRENNEWGCNNKIAYDKIFTSYEFAKRWDDSIESILVK